MRVRIRERAEDELLRYAVILARCGGDVVLWAIGQVVKLKHGREHTSEALEIWAFLSFWGVFMPPVFRGCSAVFTGLEHGCVQVCSGGVHGSAVFIFR